MSKEKEYEVSIRNIETLIENIEEISDCSYSADNAEEAVKMAIMNLFIGIDIDVIVKPTIKTTRFEKIEFGIGFDVLEVE